MRYLPILIVALMALSRTSPAATHTVWANSMSFSPATIEVAPGDTIVWQYKSGYPHTVTSGIPCTADGLFYGELSGSSPTFAWEVPGDAVGEVPYFCDPHCSMGMTGLIKVVTAPPTTAACCYDDEHLGWICAELTQEDCETLSGGYWYGSGVTCTSPQVECELPPDGIGACCYEVAEDIFHCREMHVGNCEELGGTWYGAGILCSDPKVECETGACCYNDQDLGLICTFVTQAQCNSLSDGYWYGAGVTCNAPQVECDLPGGTEGACCYQWNCESHCEFMSEASCQDYWGSTFFANESCAEVSCPPASDEFGACCYEGAAGIVTCAEMMSWPCEDLGGIWHPGIPCECIECDSTEPVGACCFDDANLGWICTQVTQAQCEDLTAGYWYGAGVPCTAPQVECDLPGGGGCVPSPAYECAGQPNYSDPDYSQVFGGVQVAVETAAPNIFGDNVVMVFDLSDVDNAPLNSWFSLNRYSHSDWRSSVLGSIFGLALDDNGNIYVTATRSWNTDAVGFGGWGAIYRLDSITGQASVFATLPNGGASLGNITWDCVHQMFFVSNMEDGRIYRLDANGNILSWFDHGVPWNGQAGPVALGDRPWAVEAHGGRLYYSMWNENYNGSSGLSNEIWSVELNPMGDFVGGAQLEVTLPSFSASHAWSSPVSDIRFSPSGTMFMAERTMSAFETVAAHYARVLEYVCVDGDWVLSQNSYGVGGGTGFTGGIAGTNATGGVDVDLDLVWASGDALALHAPPPHSNIYGFTGIPVSGGTVNDSLIIDYQDNMTYQDKTMLGDLVVTSPVEDCPADLDGDGVTNVDDLLIVIGGWGGTEGDVDGDGATDIDDLLILLAAFGPC